VGEPWGNAVTPAPQHALEILDPRSFVKKLRRSVGMMEDRDDATLVLHDFESTVG
jgi:hypothetical protein